MYPNVLYFTIQSNSFEFSAIPYAVGLWRLRPLIPFPLSTRPFYLTAFALQLRRALLCQGLSL